MRTSVRREQSGYIPEVDGLRGLAVGLVLMFHLGLPWVGGGFVGVDVFFVISGFLITRLIAREVTTTGDLDLLRFYERRVRRILPALFATLLASAVGAFLLLSPPYFERFGGALAAAGASVSNVFFWSETGYFDTAAELKPLLHTWSLGIEEQFYLFWPVLIAAALRSRGTRGTIAILAALGGASLALDHLATSGIGVSAQAPSAFAAFWLADPRALVFFWLPFRVFEFAIGALCVWVPRPGRPSGPASTALLLSGLAAIGLAAMRFTGASPGTWLIVPCLGAALVIHARESRAARLLLGNRPMVGLGRISYSLYLVHWPLISFYRYLALGESDPVSQAALAALSGVLAVAMYRWVETPFRYGSQPPGASRIGGGRAIGLGLVGMAVFACLGLAIHRSEGMPLRVPVERAEMARYAVRYGAALLPELEDPSYRIALIGESHATHFANLLITYFSPLGIGVERRVGAGCLPVPGLISVHSRERFGFGRQQTDCEEYSDRLIRGFPEQYDGIVLAARWANYTEPGVPEHPGGAVGAVHLVSGRDFDPDRLSPEASKRLLRDRLHDWLSVLNASGTPVLILGQVPPTGVDLLDCITRPAFIDLPCRPALTREDVARRLAFSNALFAELAEEFDNVVFADSLDLLCAGEDRYCPVFLDGVYLYRDDDHLNMRASAALVDRYRPALDRFRDRVLRRRTVRNTAEGGEDRAT